MPEQIYKLQPDRTVHLRGYDDRGAAAALYAASPTGFTVSGVFRDPADFAVLILWDADCFFEHPRMKYLPDFDFSGQVLQFDVAYSKLQPLDSQKFPTIDWPYLDVVPADGSPTRQITLFNHAALVGGSCTAATGTFTVETPGAAAFDRLTLWFQNIGFDFVAVGGETDAQVATALAALINDTDWTTQGGLAALWATTVGPSIQITYARYGQVTTAGRQINLTGGQSFAGMAAGDPLMINGQATRVVSFDDATALHVADDLGNQVSVPYLAGRGGYDGNMVTMFATAKNANLAAAQTSVKFAGGSSAATWRITLDFTALAGAIPKGDQIRQMWITFAPRLADSGAYQSEEWDAVFTNWGVTDPNGNRKLQVAAQNSVRVEETDYGCSYSGSSWGSEAGFYSRGFAARATTAGDSATIEYTCQLGHDLYLGTSLYGDRGKWSVSVDGDAPTILDTRVSASAAINTRRLLRAGVASGEHTVVLTHQGGGPAYFDFIEAVVEGDVPDPAGPFPLRSPALDFDTDHTYKLSPQRLLWFFDTLGFTGPMNEYLGVFWWNQRKLVGATVPQAVITLRGTFVDQDQLFVNVSGTPIGKTVFPADTLATIAEQLAANINETYSGIWAQAAGNVLTITSRSAAASGAYNFTLTVPPPQSAAGIADVVGNLNGSVPGKWVIDPAQLPPLNYAIRQWHADFYKEVAARGRSVVTACSMELVNTPDDPANGHVWVARFPDGTAVETDTGFGVLKSNHCAAGAAEFLAYQQKVFLCLAGLQAAAGLTPELQCGEFLWWFFSNFGVANPNGGMAYYDAETKAAAIAALGRPLAGFVATTDDPAVNGGADVAFLAGRLRDHVGSIFAAVRAQYPTAVRELLWPYDVNYPVPIGRENLGGPLNFAVNLPSEWKSQGNGLDRFKLEALDFGSGTRSLDLARLAIGLPMQLGWPLDAVRYLVPVFNGGCPWEAEYLLAVYAGITSITPFAIDHVCLFGWRVEEPELRPEAVWF